MIIYIVLGLVLGGIYALFSTGLSLVFGVMRVVNVAHGEMLTFGAYGAVFFLTVLGLSPVLGVVGASLFGFALGVAIYFFAIRSVHVRSRGPTPMATFMVLTLGLSGFLQNTFMAAFGADFLKLPSFMEGSVGLFGARVTYQRIVIFVLASAILSTLFVFLKTTRVGMAIRAISENPEGAQCVGISLPYIYAVTFGVAGALAGAAGVLVAPIFRVYPTVGMKLLMKGFAVTILGGLGNVLGALVAGFLIGVTESLAVMWISAEWKDVVAFGVMIGVLVLRPQGLFGKRLAGDQA